MNTKKIVFFSSLAILTLVFVVNNPIMFGFCRGVSTSSYGAYCYDSNFSVPETILLLGLFLGVFLLIFSLITYKMRDEVFRAWWGFAWWWTLIIIVVTLFLQNTSGRGGLGIGGAVSGAFDALVLGILYVILVLVSLIKIVRTYLKLRTS